MTEKADIEVKGFGLASGTVLSVCTLVLGFTTMMTGWGAQALELMSSLYIGYAATPTGILIGAVWGLVDGTILGGSLAWLYNHFKGRI